MELVQSSAAYVITYAKDVPNSDSSYAWGAIAALSNSQVGIITAATEISCPGEAV